MKTVSKITLSLAVMLGLGIGSSYAQNATAPATLEIKEALTIALRANTTIDFGILSATTPAGQLVKLDPNDPANNLNVNPATSDIAIFDVDGGDGAEVLFTYDAIVTMTATSGAALTAGAGSTPLTLDMTPIVVGGIPSVLQSAAPLLSAATPDADVVTLAPTAAGADAGKFTVYVGGTLPTLNGQATGVYDGTFNIAVAYN